MSDYNESDTPSSKASQKPQSPHQVEDRDGQRRGVTIQQLREALQRDRSLPGNAFTHSLHTAMKVSQVVPTFDTATFRLAANAAAHIARFQAPPMPDSAIVSLNRHVMGLLHDSEQWRKLMSAASLTVNVQQLLQNMTPVHEALRAHAAFIEQITRMTAGYQTVAKSVAAALQPLKWWQPEAFKKLKKLVRIQTLAAFRRADLWPAPSMPDELIEKIADRAAEGDLRPITLMVWNHYARSNHAALEHAISAWYDDPDYADRREIFEQCLATHREKKYAVTIPTLLAQIEGIAGEFVYRSTTKTSSTTAPKLGKSGQVVKHAMEVAGMAGITDLDEAEIMHAVLVEAVIEHVQDVAFENTDLARQYKSLRKRRRLNRHATLHGIQIRYYRAMNSLRCFLLLDAMHALRKHALTTQVPAEEHPKPPGSTS